MRIRIRWQTQKDLSSVVMARTSPTAFTHLISHLAISRFRKKNPGNINELPFREKPCFDRERESASEENQRVAEMCASRRDEPGHDGWTPFAATLIGLTIAEMCEYRRDKPGYDGKA